VKLLRASALISWAVIAGIIVGGCNGVYQAPLTTGHSVYDVRDSRSRIAMTPIGDRNRPSHSWMARDAKQSDLLYISSEMTWKVDVYSYPQGKREGVLTGFNFPQGLCSDAKGDVFIPNQSESNVLEYSHGGTTPIATLRDAGEAPEACAVDPKSGTLAVANVLSQYGYGNVSLYSNATGTPSIVGDPAMELVYECGYDDKGNLFIDGLTALPSQNGVFQFAELPKGSSSFVNITLNKNIKVPGVVQWDGEFMAVGDAQSGIIYQTNGAGGKIEGTTRLAGTRFDFQPWIQGGTVVAPSSVTVKASFYHYPSGGKRYRAITIGSPFGTTVSVAGK
jgi:hypothetical protein